MNDVPLLVGLQPCRLCEAIMDFDFFWSVEAFHFFLVLPYMGKRPKNKQSTRKYPSSAHT